MDTNAPAHYPASSAEAQRPCSRYRQCPLAQCVLCCAGAVFFVCRPRAVWSTLSQVNHQLESRMRENRPSGSEGGGTLFSLPLYQAAEPRDGSLPLRTNL